MHHNGKNTSGENSAKLLSRREISTVNLNEYTA